MTHGQKTATTERSFEAEDRPAAFVRYRPQREAFRFLGSVLADERGIGLVHGPELSGQSALIRHFVRKLRTNAVVAVIDGTRMRPPPFIAKLLWKFGFNAQQYESDELPDLLTYIVAQHARAHQAPILIVENFGSMYPSTLNVLCKLASLKVNDRFALRIILVGDQHFRRVMDSPGMRPIATRLVGRFELQPLTEQETLPYLYARLQTYGVNQPDRIFVVDIGTLMHSASGGWPKKLDEIADSIVRRADSVLVPLGASAQSDAPDREADDTDTIVESQDAYIAGEADTPVDRNPPKLIVTFNRKTIQEVEMVKSRAIIGRSELSDIVVENRYVSRQHAILIRDQDGLIVIDLKSSNGTYVNSNRVTSKVLRDNDIISIGNHRIKLVYPDIDTGVSIPESDVEDTARMKTIDDARQSGTRPGFAGDGTQEGNA